jgi:hypothetical protein
MLERRAGGFRRIHEVVIGPIVSSQIDSIRFAGPSLILACRNGREIVAPVMRDIGASAEPNIVEATHIIEKLHQAGRTPRPAYQPVMQTYGEKLR